MMEFNQIISDADYKKAIAKHYFSYKYTYILPVLGLLLILGMLIIIIFFPYLFSKSPALLFLLAGFMVIRPILYIQNVFNSIKSSKLSSQETSVKITDDYKIITSTNGNQTSLNIADLYSYYDAKPFLFLYISRNQYLLLDKRQVQTKDIDHLLKTLDELNIKRR